MRAQPSGPGGLRPALLVWLAIALALLLAAYTVIALRQSRQTLERSARRSAEALAESLALATRSVTAAGDALDSLWLSRWQDAARRMAEASPGSPVPANWLYEYNSPRVDWSALNGKILKTTDPTAGSQLPVALLTDSSWSAIREGAVFAEFDRPGLLGAAVVRRDNCALVLWGATERLSATQEDFGAGHMLRSISELPGLQYVVLQSLDGIEMASRRVETMNRIADDSDLTALLETGNVLSREWQFNDQPVIEAAALVPGQGRILRVGVSRQSLEYFDRSMTLQLWLLGALLFALGLGVLALFVSSQRFVSLARDLSAAEALTDELFRGIRASLLVVDGRGMIRLANPPSGYLLGQPSGALEGKRYVDVAPGDPALLLPLLEHGEAALEQEVAWRDREGHDRVLLVSNTRLRGERGDLVAIIHDVTETRRLARQAEQNERLAAMGDLAAGVAHEIRNPLNAIGIASQRLAAEFTPDAHTDEYRTLLRHLRSEVDRVNATVQEFLGLARGFKLSRQRMDLAAIVDRAAATLKLEADQKGVTLAVSAPTMIEMTGDPEALHKVVLNLGQNALHATPEGGRILVSASAERGGVRFSVQDTGVGIDPDDLPYLFRPYFSRKRGGSGLGLALVHRIVAEHGGRVDVKSTPGQGSHFDVWLPDETRATGGPGRGQGRSSP